MEKDRLYIDIKNTICERIYKGEYKDGDNIDTERTLAESLNVSRVTVRKALQLLEKEDIIERIQGSGNVVKLKCKSYKGTMDIIAVLAPPQNPFFSAFMDHFQKKSDNNDSLVLFMQNPFGKKLEECLFKLYQKNIRNVVIWLEDQKIDIEYIRRLRGLGMNIVFFDINMPTPYADCVLLNNKHAISTLYELLKKNGAKNIGYVGWDNHSITSVSERENVFVELNPNRNMLFQIIWKEKASISNQIDELVNVLIRDNKLPDSIICGDGEIGIAVKKVFVSKGLIGDTITSIDDYPEAETLFMDIYGQDFEKMAEKSYQCLSMQNKEGWTASVFSLKGKLLEYSLKGVEKL